MFRAFDASRPPADRRRLNEIEEIQLPGALQVDFPVEDVPIEFVAALQILVREELRVLYVVALEVAPDLCQNRNKNKQNLRPLAFANIFYALESRDLRLRPAGLGDVRQF